MAQPRLEKRQHGLIVKEDRCGVSRFLPSNSGPMNLGRALTFAALAAGALYVSYLCILFFMQDALI